MCWSLPCGRASNVLQELFRTEHCDALTNKQVQNLNDSVFFFLLLSELVEIFNTPIEEFELVI